MNMSSENETDPLILIGGPELNLMSLALVILTILFCLFILLVVIRSRNPNKYSISVLLFCNTYLCVIVYSIFASTQYLRTLFGDFGSQTNNGVRFGHIFISYTADAICQWATFFFYSLLTNILLSVNVQALYRMFKVISSPGREYRLASSRKGFCGIVIIQWIVGFLLQIPNIIGSGEYRYEETQYNCIVAFANAKSTAYSSIVVYVLPSGILIGMYYYLILHLRQQRHRVVPVSSTSNNSKRRDLLVIKRIIISVGVLITIGIPSLFLMFYFVLTKIIVPIRYRIQCLGFAVSIAVFSVILLFISPQLMELLPERLRQGMLFRRRRNNALRMPVTVTALK